MCYNLAVDGGVLREQGLSAMATVEEQEAQEAQPPVRAQLPDVARNTGIPERTLQHWFREYGSYRSRRGYPLQLIVDVLREHEWEGDTSLLLRGVADVSAQPDAIERRAPQVGALLQEHDQQLSTLSKQHQELAAVLERHLQQQDAIEVAFLHQLVEFRQQSTQVATLNELRGLREEILALRAGQQQTQQTQRALLAAIQDLRTTIAAQRAPTWWKFWQRQLRIR